jgi:hypothetical protein
VNTGGSNENEAFCEMVDENFLQQFISGPTHIAGNKPDLLLCNSPKPVKRQVFDYRNGKFDELRNFLTRNPINITPTNDINNYWEQ